jgi:HK97 family phage portal protein
MAAVFDLTARQGQSKVLSTWLAGRPGAVQRAGVDTASPQSALIGENATTQLTLGELASMLGAAHRTASGAVVTPDTAMRVATVYGCVSLIAGAIATLPVGIFERKGNTRDRADHDYWWFLNEQACEDMTSAAAWEWIIAAKLFYGDGYAELLRPSPSSSRAIGWKPLHPKQVQCVKEPGRKVYRVTDDDGTVRVLPDDDIIHLPSLGFDGVSSPSPITYAAREAIGTSLAAEEYAARFFSGGATFDYALKTDKQVSQEQLADMKESLIARATSGQRLPLILTGGLQPAQLSVNSKDAEILGTRMFSVEEICRVFGVPPHMVGHTEKTTSWGSGLEQQGSGFVRYTLQRHLTPIAQELNRKLWPTRAKYFVEHITAALERGDLKSRYEAYRIGLGRAGEQPFLDPDEVRRLENMPPNSKLQTNAGNANAQPTDPTTV